MCSAYYKYNSHYLQALVFYANQLTEKNLYFMLTHTISLLKQSQLSVVCINI